MRTRIAGGLLSRALCALDWAYMPNNKKNVEISTLSKKEWCPDSELNQGHGDFQSPALPTELSGHTHFCLIKFCGGPSGTRTQDLPVMSRTL